MNSWAARGCLFVLTVLVLFSDSTRSSAVDRLEVAATAGLFNVSSMVEVTGNGTSVVGEIQLHAGVGTVVYQGIKTPAVAHQTFPYNSWMVVYQVLLVQPSTSKLAIIWIYCNTGTKTVDLVWYEDSNGTIFSGERGSGPCSDNGVSSIINVTLPAISLPLPTLVSGAFIKGSQISLNGSGPGWLRLAHINWQLLPYSAIDCSSCAQPGQGWYEYHALLWDSVGKQLNIGILSFMQARLDHVILSSCVQLPSVAKSLPNTGFRAVWNTTLSKPAPLSPLTLLRRPPPLALSFD